MLGTTRALLIDVEDRGAGAPKRYRFRASGTGQARGDNFLLSADGWDLSNYRNYPVILAGHDSSRFPIGIATSVEVDADGLLDEVEFDDGDELGRAAMRKLDKGHPIAQSVAFKSLEADRSPSSNGLIKSARHELYEISMVGLPSDPTALPMRGFDALDVATRLALIDALGLADEAMIRHPNPEPETAPEPSLLDLLTSVRARLAVGLSDLSDAERLAITNLYGELRRELRVLDERQVNPVLIARLESLTHGER